LLYCMISQNFN